MDSWDSPWPSRDQDDRPTYHDEYRAVPGKDPSSLDSFEREVLSLLTDYRSASETHRALKGHEHFTSYKRKMEDFSLVGPRNLWADIILAVYALNAVTSFLSIPLFIMILFMLFRLPIHRSIMEILAPFYMQQHFKLILILLLGVIAGLFASCYYGYLYYMMIHRNNADFLRIHFGHLPTVNYNRFISAYEEIHGPVGEERP
jgi:hypothetical protein